VELAKLKAKNNREMKSFMQKLFRAVEGC